MLWPLGDGSNSCLSRSISLEDKCQVQLTHPTFVRIWLHANTFPLSIMPYGNLMKQFRCCVVAQLLTNVLLTQESHSAFCSSGILSWFPQNLKSAFFLIEFPYVTWTNPAFQLLSCIDWVVEGSIFLSKSLSETRYSKCHLSESCWSVALYRGNLTFSCRCLKLKVDKTKMLATSGVKKAIFDRLCNQLEKMSQQLSSKFLVLSL